MLFRSAQRSKHIFVAAAFAALAAYAFIGGSFGLDLVTKIMIYAIFALRACENNPSRPGLFSQALRPGHAILLVEHDMDAVFRIADGITVMVNGSVIASGTPESVRNNDEVRHAYLGHD